MFAKIPIWGPIDNRQSNIPLKEKVTITEGVTINKYTKEGDKKQFRGTLTASANFSHPLGFGASSEVSVSGS